MRYYSSAIKAQLDDSLIQLCVGQVVVLFVLKLKRNVTRWRFPAFAIACGMIDLLDFRVLFRDLIDHSCGTARWSCGRHFDYESCSVVVLMRHFQLTLNNHRRRLCHRRRRWRFTYLLNRFA